MKNKKFYYVVVQSEGQAKFVTKVDHNTKYAHWEKDKKPQTLSKNIAEDLAYCLSLNLFPAYVLTSFYEIPEQIFIKGEEI